jgi:hypothetical protein
MKKSYQSDGPVDVPAPVRMLSPIDEQKEMNSMNTSINFDNEYRSNTMPTPSEKMG